jgi:sugar lactone lactonase YvrE
MPAGSLWVADYYKNRVVSFPHAATAPTGANIGVVLGQGNVTATATGLTAFGLNEPRGLAIDAADNLYIADYGNHRVLRFNQVTNKPTGSSANAVIGQPDFTTASTTPNAALLKNPSGICLDAQARLWVADTGKNRIARYNSPLAVSPTDSPTGYLGGNPTLDASGMFQPIAVTVTSGGTLWVSDYRFNRVLRFEMAASKPDAASADGVLGAPNLTTSYSESRTRSEFYRPEGLFVDATGSLWIPDTSNARLLKFLPAMTAVISAYGINGQGKFNLTFHGVPGSTYLLRSSTDLKVWDLEQTYNLGDALPHSFVNLKSGTRRFFRLEEP